MPPGLWRINFTLMYKLEKQVVEGFIKSDATSYDFFFFLEHDQLAENVLLYSSESQSS